MTDIVTFPCEYLMFSTGYEHRLMMPIITSRFEALCAEIEVIPLAIYQPTIDNPIPTVITVRNGHIVIDEEPTEEETTIASNISGRLWDNNLHHIGVILRVANFENATKIVTRMHTLKYCRIEDLRDIKFLRNEYGVIDIAYFDYNADDLPDFHGGEDMEAID